jgi:hypothetical protein
MINFSIHNVTQVTKTRINTSDYDKSGWIVLTLGAQSYSWGDEKQETVSNEVTFFFKDLELGLAQLRTEIDKGIASFRIDEATTAMAKVKEDAEKELNEVTNG